MSNELRQSQSSRAMVFLMVDSADHITGKTGLSPTVTISKNGGSFASPAGSVSEIGSGWYKVAGNSTDTNTLGTLVLHATATGADPTDLIFNVVENYLPTDIKTWNGTPVATRADSGWGGAAFPAVSIAEAVGNLPANIMAIYGNALTSNMVNADISAVFGTTLTSNKVPASLAYGDVTGNLPASIQSVYGVPSAAYILMQVLRMGANNVFSTADVTDSNVVTIDTATTPGAFDGGWFIYNVAEPKYAFIVSVSGNTVTLDRNVTLTTIDDIVMIPPLPSHDINGGGGGSGPSAATIAAAVVDQALSGHTTAGTVGGALSNAATVDDLSNLDIVVQSTVGRK